jgi:hypothetical protein
MKANSMKGLGILALFAAFTLLAGVLTTKGNVLPVLFALAGAGVCVGAFFSVKPWEYSKEWRLERQERLVGSKAWMDQTRSK